MKNKAEAEKNTQSFPKLRAKPRERSRMPRGTRLSAKTTPRVTRICSSRFSAPIEKAPEVTRKRIYLETIGKVLATQQRDDGNGGFVVEQGPRKIIMDEDAKGLLPLLNLNQEAK